MMRCIQVSTVFLYVCDRDLSGDIVPSDENFWLPMNGEGSHLAMLPLSQNNITLSLNGKIWLY
jgi:hypothetical protein